MSKLQDLIDSLCPNGVEFKPLGEVCKFINGFAFKSNLFKEDGLSIIRITNINGSSVDMNDVKFFHKEDYNVNLEQFSVHTGDILVAMSGATTGKIGYYNAEQTSYLNQRVVVGWNVLWTVQLELSDLSWSKGYHLFYVNS